MVHSAAAGWVDGCCCPARSWVCDVLVEYIDAVILTLDSPKGPTIEDDVGVALNPISAVQGAV